MGLQGFTTVRQNAFGDGKTGILLGHSACQCFMHNGVSAYFVILLTTISCTTGEREVVSTESVSLANWIRQLEQSAVKK